MSEDIRKAIVTIAVSKYDGHFSNLPGTIVSAKRMATWAAQPLPGLGYTVLEITDAEPGSRVTVERVRDELNDLVESNFIDRLMIYFAGHGIARSESDQFWLLSGAANDTREGIDVRAFRRGLSKLNIGESSHILDGRGQIVLIGDACRNTGQPGMNFHGDPIITKTSAPNRAQYDLFFATTLGEFAFQPEATNTADAYCLFSQAILDLLSGEFAEAIETEHHPFAPAITNHKLGNAVETLASKRAAELNETMDPDIWTGIRPPHNYYARLTGQPPLSSSPSTSAAQPVLAMGRKPNTTTNAPLTKSIRTAQAFGRPSFHNFSVNHGDDPLTESWPRSSNGVVTDLAGGIWASRYDRDRFEVTSQGRFLLIKNKSDGIFDPIFIRSEMGWTLAPFFDNTTSYVIRGIPGDVILRRDSAAMNYTFGDWDVGLSDISVRLGKSPRRASEANKMADNIRPGKAYFPSNALAAAYLYEFSGDYDNISRTAHFMSEWSGAPFDLGMLSASRLRWKKALDGRLQAFADLPAVDEGEEEERPTFANTSFIARENIRLLGQIPVYRQGWKFLQTERYLDAPDEILAIANEVKGRSATNLTDRGMEIFQDFFEYKPLEIYF